MEFEHLLNEAKKHTVIREQLFTALSEALEGDSVTADEAEETFKNLKNAEKECAQKWACFFESFGVDVRKVLEGLDTESMSQVLSALSASRFGHKRDSTTIAIRATENDEGVLCSILGESAFSTRVNFVRTVKQAKGGYFFVKFDVDGEVIHAPVVPKKEAPDAQIAYNAAKATHEAAKKAEKNGMADALKVVYTLMLAFFEFLDPTPCAKPEGAANPAKPAKVKAAPQPKPKEVSLTSKKQQNTAFTLFQTAAKTLKAKFVLFQARDGTMGEGKFSEAVEATSLLLKAFGDTIPGPAPTPAVPSGAAGAAGGGGGDGGVEVVPEAALAVAVVVDDDAMDVEPNASSAKLNELKKYLRNSKKTMCPARLEELNIMCPEAFCFSIEDQALCKMFAKAWIHVTNPTLTPESPTYEAAYATALAQFSFKTEEAAKAARDAANTKASKPLEEATAVAKASMEAAQKAFEAAKVRDDAHGKGKGKGKTPSDQIRTSAGVRPGKCKGKGAAVAVGDSDSEGEQLYDSDDEPLGDTDAANGGTQVRDPENGEEGDDVAAAEEDGGDASMHSPAAADATTPLPFSAGWVAASAHEEEEEEGDSSDYADEEEEEGDAVAVADDAPVPPAVADVPSAPTPTPTPDAVMEEVASDSPAEKACKAKIARLKAKLRAAEAEAEAKAKADAAAAAAAAQAAAEAKVKADAEEAARLAAAQAAEAQAERIRVAEEAAAKQAAEEAEAEAEAKRLAAEQAAEAEAKAKAEAEAERRKLQRERDAAALDAEIDAATKEFGIAQQLVVNASTDAMETDATAAVGACAARLVELKKRKRAIAAEFLDSAGGAGGGSSPRRHVRVPAAATVAVAVAAVATASIGDRCATLIQELDDLLEPQ